MKSIIETFKNWKKCQEFFEGKIPEFRSKDFILKIMLLESSFDD